jgi:group I intron endonuclease
MIIISGIYKITNTDNGKCYIGSAVNVQRRFCEHRCKLNKKNHCNGYLQASWEKHGETKFKFEIIEEVADKNDLVKREQFYLDSFKSYDGKHGYNLCVAAGSQLGMVRSDQTKAKISASLVGRPVSDKTKTKISVSKRGRVASDETRAKMSASAMGKVISDETRAKMSKRAIHTGKGYYFDKKHQRWVGRFNLSGGKFMIKKFHTEAAAAAWVSEMRVSASVM